MLSLKEMTASLQESASLRNESINDEVTRLRYAEQQYVRTLAELESNLPALEKGFKKVGLCISQLGYHQTGDKYWTSNTCLNVSIQAVPTDGKFKFIQFNGYTSSGSGKNQARLSEKAAKIHDVVKEVSGLEINVNCYSLEKRDDQTSKRVLIELWIK